MNFFCRVLLIIFFFFSCHISFAQTDSCRLRISLLTCGPGNELYSIWGHTGIRVIDSSTRLDIVFNYGMFDDSDPYFYVKFTRGIMRYSVAGEYFSDFMQEYIHDKRSVTEQELELGCREKKDLFSALKENIKNENRSYDYQFYKDNCTTRAKEIIKKITSEPILFKNILPAKTPTYRELIHQYLDSSGHSWDKFGIDLLLGTHLDEPATNEKAMFLPDYLMKGFDSASLHQQKLVSSKKVILAPGDRGSESFTWFTPFFLFALLAIVFILLSFNNSSASQKILIILDALFFFFTGLLGILMAALWLGRVDEVCRNNMNILWAWPTHVVMAFLAKKKTNFVKNYFLAGAVTSVFLLLGWFWWPQQFNNAFTPLLTIIIVRGFSLSRKK